jgi:hypothetical protein
VGFNKINVEANYNLCTLLITALSTFFIYSLLKKLDFLLSVN